MRAVRSGLRSNAAMWLLLAAALFLRAIVPHGYMPERSEHGAFTVRLCGEANAVLVRATQHHGEAHHHHEQKGEEHAAQPCAFAGLSAPAFTPRDLPPLLLPAAVVVAFPHTPVAFAAILAPRLLPPPTGPPPPA
jgi:hypothetical protein